MSNRIGIGIDVFGAGIDADATTIYNRIIADGGVSNLTRLNFFVKGLKAIYGDLANVPVCYDAHWIGYKLGSGTGATAGQAAAKLYSLTVAGDAVQTTAASQPLLLAHNGASSDNYWWGSGVSGNYVASQSQSALKFDADFSVVVNVESFLAGNHEVAGSPFTAFAIEFNRLLSFNFSGVRYVSTVAILTTTKWIRYSASGTSLLFYTSNDGVTWTQLGTTITMSARTTPANSSIFAAKGSASIANPINGKINRILYYTDSSLASLIYDFNPATYNAATSQTAWTSTTGEIWTISTGTATVGYKGVLVDRVIVQGDKTDDALISGTLSSRQLFTSYSAHRFFIYTGNQTVYSGSTNSHLLYTGTSTQTAYNGTNLGSGNSSILTNIATIDFGNIGGSKIRINAGADTVGDAGNQSSTDCKLFVYGGTNFGNVILNTLIQTNSINTDAQKTATYNFLKTLNNL